MPFSIQSSVVLPEHSACCVAKRATDRGALPVRLRAARANTRFGAQPCMYGRKPTHPPTERSVSLTSSSRESDQQGQQSKSEATREAQAQAQEATEGGGSVPPTAVIQTRPPHHGEALVQSYVPRTECRTNSGRYCCTSLFSPSPLCHTGFFFRCCFSDHPALVGPTAIDIVNHSQQEGSKNKSAAS